MLRMSVVHEQKVLHARIFYAASKPINGLTETPADFAAVRGRRLLIRGNPSHDVMQAAYAACGMGRLEVDRYPVDVSAPGMLLCLTA